MRVAMKKPKLRIGDLVEYESTYLSNVKAIAIITFVNDHSYDLNWLHISDKRAQWNNDSLQKGYPIDMFNKEHGWRKLS